jgi:hypothetical protein
MPSESESNEDETASKSKPGSASKSIQAAQDSLYAVMMEDTDKAHNISVGTAWAASRRYLVTTASVIAAIEDRQQQGMIASVVHVGSGKSYRIKTKKIHETYSKAAEAVEDARERKDNDKVATEKETQLRFDLGVLDVGRTEKLPHKIAFDAEPIENTKDAAFVMVGIPCSEKDDDDQLPEAGDIKERRCKKLAASSRNRNPAAENPTSRCLELSGSVA